MAVERIAAVLTLSHVEAELYIGEPFLSRGSAYMYVLTFAMNQRIGIVLLHINRSVMW
jgi:hypothetical protein